MALNQSSGISPVVQATWDRKLLIRAQPNLLYSRVTQQRPIGMREGKTMKFRRYTKLALALTPLVEGTPPTGKTIAYTDISVGLQQWGDYAAYTDILQWTTDHPLINEFNALLAEQAGETKDALIRDVVCGGTNVFYGGTAAARTDLTTTTHLVTTAALDKINRNLMQNNAKRFTSVVGSSQNVGTTGIRAAWFAITTPEVYYTLMGLTGWVPLEQYASQGPVMPGEVGAYKDFRFLVSTNAKKLLAAGGLVSGVAGTTNADVHFINIFGQNAVGDVPLSTKSMQQIMKELGSAGTSDPLDQVGTVGWKHTGARVILNDAFMARLEVTVAL